MTGTLAVILVFGGLIFFHELGHFLLARLFGVGVKTFSLGFGPALWSRRYGKTKYQIAALPLGGFVALVGESPDAEIPEPFTAKESYSLRPAWQRLPIIAAGSVFNLLLAWLICWGLVFANGKPAMTKEEMPAVIGEIRADGPAASSPLQAGDRVTAVDGAPIARWMDLPQLIREKKDQPLEFTVDRAGETLRFSITPKLLATTLPSGETVENVGIGIMPQPVPMQEYGFFASAGEGAKSAWDMGAQIWKGLVRLVSGKEEAKNVGGPILIAQAIYQEADRGLVGLLVLTAAISVNLGILNLLPIPVLDGGHIFFLLGEIIFRRRIPLKVQEYAMTGGLLFLLGLMLFATFNDIGRFFN